MNDAERFQNAFIKLIIQHPGRVVWVGGWEGRMTVGWLDIPISDVIRAKTALRAVMEDEGFEIMLSNVDSETLRLEKNRKTPEALEAQETVEELFLQFNQAVSENPGKLVVIASAPKGSSNSGSEGVFIVICAPDLSALQKTKERGWKVLCYSWKGKHYEVRDGSVIPIKTIASDALRNRRGPS